MRCAKGGGPSRLQPARLVTAVAKMSYIEADSMTTTPPNRVAGRIDLPSCTPPDVRPASGVHNGLHAMQVRNKLG